MRGGEATVQRGGVLDRALWLGDVRVQNLQMTHVLLDSLRVVFYICSNEARTHQRPYP